MEKKEIERDGRKYIVLVEGDNEIVVGPPEGMVDELGIPEPAATRLHNILFSRGLLTFKDLAHQKNAALGAVQEALMIDAQRLTEAYYRYGG